jgi:hypothetical protein
MMQQADLISLLFFSKVGKVGQKEPLDLPVHTQYKGRCLALAGACLVLLPSNFHLSLVGVTLSVLSSFCPDVVGRCSKQTILSPSERGDKEVCCCTHSSTYIERPNPSLVKEETPSLGHVNVYERTKIFWT